MHAATSRSLASAALLLSAAAAFAQTVPTSPKAAKGYTLGVFARGVTGKYSVPDSIAVDRTHVYVGYGDGNKPDGSDGKNTQIVQYDLSGHVEHIYAVKGHNDGLKVDPASHLLWALQNEDSNPLVVLLDPRTFERQQLFFEAPPTAGGGYDDIVFRAGKIYLSASNPANSPNSGAAIVQARIQGSSIAVSPVLNGNAQATDVVTGSTVTLNLQDPDSMTLTPSGALFLTSQADSELIVVRKPGEKTQSVLQIPLTSPFGTPMVDDTLFIPNSDGFMLIADKPANTVYTLRRTAFVPGAAYSAAQAVSGATTESFLGRLDLEYGILTPVVTGLGNPGGLGYVRIGDDDANREERVEYCQKVLADN